MMDKKRYGVDTVALLAYFADVLSSKGDRIFKTAETLETELIVPEIVIGETLYTIKKGKTIFGKQVPLDVQSTILQTLFHSSMY